MTDNTTNIGYKGTVTIKLKTTSGEVISITNHNGSLEGLRKVFARFMAGSATFSSDRPKYVNLIYINEEGVTEQMLYKKSKVTAGEYVQGDESGTWVAKLTSSIQYEQLVREVSESDTGTYKLILCGDTNTAQSPVNAKQISPSEQELAELTVESQSLSKIIPGTRAVIEWKMQLTDV